MASKAEQIAVAVVSALTVPPMSTVSAASVYRDPAMAVQSGVWPVITVETGPESAPQRVLIGKKDRTLTITVGVMFKGANPYAACDAALEESFGRIIADLSLGGLALDITEGGTERARDFLDKDVGAVRKDYIIEYRTGETSLAV